MGKKKAKAHKPNSTQIKAACAVMKQFAVETKGTASDTAIQSAVYSVLAAAGLGGNPAAQYSMAIEQATGGEIKVKKMTKDTEDGFEVTAENPLGLAVGKVYVDAAHLEGGDEPAEPGSQEPSGNDDELPTEGALNKMNKAALIAQAKTESVEASDGMTNTQIVKAILAARS